jgi:hypothetical protein
VTTTTAKKVVTPKVTAKRPRGDYCEKVTPEVTTAKWPLRSDYYCEKVTPEVMITAKRPRSDYCEVTPEVAAKWPRSDCKLTAK